MSALTDLFTALANKIRTKTGGSDTYTPPQMVNAIDDVYNAGVAAGTPTLTGDAAAADVKSGKTFYGNTLTKQTGTFAADTNNTITAGTSAKTVNPDSGKYFASVTVNPTPTETKTQAPGTTAIDVEPTSGKHLSKVTVSAIQTETKTQAAGTSNIDVEPTSGKYLTKVTITPQQHSQSFTPTANLVGASGNANDMGVSHNNRYVNTSGMIVPSGNKSINANGTNIDVSSFATASVNVPSPTINSITPSNSSPAAMSSGNNYSPTAAGYAISSYSSVTPSSSGTYFSGGMVKMDRSGYAYSSRPSIKKSTSTFWTNSAPTSSFAGQVITLSNGMSAYDYLIIRFKSSTSATYEWDVYVNVNDFINAYYQSGSGDSTGAMTCACYYNASGSNTYTFIRPFTRKSDTQISFSNCRRATSSAATTTNTALIPISVKGIYYYT